MTSSMKSSEHVCRLCCATPSAITWRSVITGSVMRGVKILFSPVVNFNFNFIFNLCANFPYTLFRSCACHCTCNAQIYSYARPTTSTVKVWKQRSERWCIGWWQWGLVIAEIGGLLQGSISAQVRLLRSQPWYPNYPSPKQACWPSYGMRQTCGFELPMAADSGKYPCLDP